ncbi:TPA: HAD family hydrolase [Aeromonas veronii]|uniref:HAD family hydrolase n=1 Tax=Aeromonas veronii TaxID=654 RepID=UPI00307E64D7
MNYLSKLDGALQAQPIRAISCDVFDTLIFRHAGTVEQFWQQLALQAYQLGILCNDDPEAFVEYRKEAESMARRQMMQREGHREVRLEHIYACWSSAQGEQLAQLEQQLEYDNWWLNPVLVDWLASQQQRGLPIVLLSDMYLPASLLQRFFSTKAPQLLLHRIYVSGEYRASKQDGGLYQRLLAEQQWSPASVLHIGDDKITDLQMAKASGLSACYVGLGDDYLAQLKYEQRLFPLAIPGLERLRRQWRWLSDGSASSGIASHVYAPVLYAFARWLIVRCQQQGITTLFCLLREGDVIARLVAQIPGHTLTVKTLAVSRRSSFLPSREWSLELLHPLCQRRGYTLAELLEDLGLECSPVWFQHRLCTLSALVQTPLWLEVLSWLETVQPQIVAHLQQQRQWLLQYLVQQGVTNAPEIAILDWGCGGSLLQNLHQLVGLDDVTYFMFYASQRASRVALSQKLQIFQPASCQAWAQQLAAYPEISEILLNGALSSTRCYQITNDGQITTKPVAQSDDAILGRQSREAFVGILLRWGEQASAAGWMEEGPSLAERHYLVGILYRLILYPMWHEARELANLSLPMAPGCSQPLLPHSRVIGLKERVCSGEQAYQLLLDGTDPILRNTVWYPGLVALAFPDQLQQCGELAIYQDDEKVAPLLLQKLRQSGITKTALYGAGELGLKVYEFLTAHGINICCVIDRRALNSCIRLGEHQVITLAEAKRRDVDCFTVASRAFASEISAEIRLQYNDKTAGTNIIVFR